MLRYIKWQVGACAWLLLSGTSADAQERFELFIPGSQVRSTAERTAGTLNISNAGTTHTYNRDAQFDAAGYSAYSSAALRRVIRWPTAGQGNLRIGTITGLGAITFQPSKMQVRRIGGIAPPPPPPLPPAPPLGAKFDTDFLYRMHNLSMGIDWALDGSRQARPVEMARTGKFESQHWKFTPVAGGRFLLTNVQLGPQWSLAVDRQGHLDMIATADVPTQYWRMVPQGKDVYQLVNDALNLPLDVDAKHGNAPTVDSLDVWKGEHWIVTGLYRARPPIAGGPRLVSSEPRPPAPLKPANVELANTHRRELWVLLTDRRDPQHPRRLKIPAGTAQTVSIDRALVRSLWKPGS